MDGIILTHEIIHSLKQSKKSGMLLKIDLSKAFDSLIWKYIQKMLLAIGFSPSSVRWVMSLITSTFLSILVNGIPSTSFHRTRGIQQGDPLSPFLFVIMAEGLGRSIKEALHSQKLRGLSFPNTLAYTHQQFMDDNMLSGHPSVEEAFKLNSILTDFSSTFGACINKAKS